MKRLAVFSRARDVITRKIGDAVILVLIRKKILPDDALYSLNKTGSFIWDSFNGKRTVVDITELLAEKCGKPSDIISQEVMQYVEDLEKNKLVVKLKN